MPVEYDKDVFDCFKAVRQRPLLVMKSLRRSGPVMPPDVRAAAL